MCRVHGGKLARALWVAISVCFVSAADAQILTFDDNSLPSGWSPWFSPGSTGRNLQFVNQRMEIGQIDTYAGIARQVDASNLAAITVSFDGNFANVYWGQGIAAGLMRDTGLWNAGATAATAGKAGFGNDQLLFSIGHYDGTGGHNDLTSYAAPQYGNYHVTVEFMGGKSSITVAPINSPITPIFQSGWVNQPGFTLQDMRSVVVWGATTTGASAWIDNVAVTTVNRTPSVSPTIFKDWAVVAQSTPSALNLDRSLSSLPVYGPVNLPANGWNDAVIASADWLKRNAYNPNNPFDISRTMRGLSNLATIGAAVSDLVGQNPDKTLALGIDLYALASASLINAGRYDQLPSQASLDYVLYGLSGAKSTVDIIQAGKCGVGSVIDCVGLAFSANALIWDNASIQWKQFGEDPVDPDFRTIVRVADYESQVNGVFGAGPATGPGKVLRDELVAAAKVAALLKAANQSMDKYAGAVAAGDTSAADMQMSKVLDYVAAYNEAAFELTDLVAAARAVVASSGFGASVDLTGLAELQASIRATGRLPQTIVDKFSAAGFSADQIAAITTAISGLDSSSIANSLAPDQIGLGANLPLYSVTAVPEPSTCFLAAIGLAGLLFNGRRIAVRRFASVLSR